MNYFDIYYVVRKLIGNITPIGDDGTNKERYCNLLDQCKLLNTLFLEVYNVYDSNKDNENLSNRRCAEKARDTLKEILDFYSDKIK